MKKEIADKWVAAPSSVTRTCEAFRIADVIEAEWEAL